MDENEKALKSLDTLWKDYDLEIPVVEYHTIRKALQSVPVQEVNIITLSNDLTAESIRWSNDDNTDLWRGEYLAKFLLKKYPNGIKVVE